MATPGLPQAAPKTKRAKQQREANEATGEAEVHEATEGMGR